MDNSYKKDNSSIEKHRLKHIGKLHEEMLKIKFDDKSLNWKASMVRHLALDASIFDYSMMDSTFISNYMLNTRKILTGLFQMIITIDHTWFSACVRVYCLSQNEFSYCITNLYKYVAKINHSNSWHLISRTCFHCKIHCAPLSVPPVMQHHKQKKPLQCRFRHIFTAYLHQFNKFQNF